MYGRENPGDDISSQRAPIKFPIRNCFDEKARSFIRPFVMRRVRKSQTVCIDMRRYLAEECETPAGVVL